MPIVAVSANAYASDIADCRDAGMNDHVAKPYTLETLGAAVERWSGKQASTRVRASDQRGKDIASAVLPLFLDQCAAAARKTDGLLLALRSGSEGTREMAAEVRGIAHKLSGTAASFGAGELGRVAAQAEEVLAEIGPSGLARDKAAEIIVDRFSTSLREFLGPLAA